MDDEVQLTPKSIEGLTKALQDSRNRTEQQLARLESKLDQLSRDLVVAEGEIRRELQTQFVTKAEYDPRHRIIENQIVSTLDVVNKHIADAETRWREQAVMRVEISQLQEDYKDLDTRQRGATARAVPWIAVAIAFLSAVFQILQHVQFR